MNLSNKLYKDIPYNYIIMNSSDTKPKKAEVVVKFSEDYDHYFESKEMKRKLRDKLKAIYNKTLDEQKFSVLFTEKKQELITNYLKFGATSKYVFTTSVIKREETVTIGVFIQHKESNIDNLKQMMRYRRLDLKDQRLNKNIKKETVEYKKDPRVTVTMADFYEKARRYSPYVPNPAEILDDLDNVKLEFYTYLMDTINNKMDVYSKEMLLKNEYTSYMTLMTDIPVVMPQSMLNELNKSNVAVENVTDIVSDMKKEKK
ncbi:MAG: hypothetical protein Faunusvirus19_3 [Faunusvirus sp.]|jgi:hypothetical protein|uniref:Uncharacterized protein n=1 Tax=Faunusvirus sp. TaxID=2487766 RepID=A0A3G5A0X4_9VIRU|nr:MAG: hypothetical protein Faunusvirus19_3 [Faunusvirus sp.]